MRAMTRTTSLLLPGAIALRAIEPAWARTAYGDWPAGMHWMWGTWGIGMALVMLLFWTLLITVLVLALRWLAGVSRPRHVENPLDLVKRRYARGEISREEYDAAKQELR